ncbi:hypothetical protein [Bacillus sp. T33-2]|uniref:hypothetical protein n=1 Tax=Bacillus sp. T33-2 TaxID=2054168 RepID=UPI000C76CE39|nr:hypothetical protein [Bacillus sp. T33-2]PLR99520.1 hypothetical protein CVD19_00220 [Bacillus sp. T33-2]
MLYKCNYCDPVAKKGEKTIKSVDTERDTFIKDDKGKYYHLECFKLHLSKRKKIIDEDEIKLIIKELTAKTQLVAKENTEKDHFLKWIMNFYDGSLPSYFLKKLQSVRDGTHESINEPIAYGTLLDIYQYMERYLLKIAAKKKIENVSQRMNYDLAVVLGNYGDYKKFKHKQQGFSAEKNEVDKQIKIDNKLSNIDKANKNQDHNKEFDITDVIQDLLL